VGAEALGERRPTLIKMDAAVKAKVNALFGNSSDNPPARS
jgi:hypothetical protein